MKKNVLSILIVLLSIIFWNCSDDKSDEKTIDISGITFIDNYGRSYMNLDTSDWRIDDTWTADEESLFPTRMIDINNKKSCSNYNHDVLAYPIPCREIIRFEVMFGNDYLFLDFRLVDNHLNILQKIDSMCSSNFVTRLDSNLVFKQKYRIYYKIYTTEKVYRGHGDIQIGEFEDLYK